MNDCWLASVKAGWIWLTKKLADMADWYSDWIWLDGMLVNMACWMWMNEWIWLAEIMDEYGWPGEYGWLKSLLIWLTDRLAYLLEGSVNMACWIWTNMTGWTTIKTPNLWNRQTNCIGWKFETTRSFCLQLGQLSQRGNCTGWIWLAERLTEYGWLAERLTLSGWLKGWMNMGQWKAAEYGWLKGLTNIIYWMTVEWLAWSMSEWLADIAGCKTDWIQLVERLAEYGKVKRLAANGWLNMAGS